MIILAKKLSQIKLGRTPLILTIQLRLTIQKLMKLQGQSLLAVMGNVMEQKIIPTAQRTAKNLQHPDLVAQAGLADLIQRAHLIALESSAEIMDAKEAAEHAL